jgi:hypothetical protein
VISPLSHLARSCGCAAIIYVGTNPDTERRIRRSSLRWGKAAGGARLKVYPSEWTALLTALQLSTSELQLIGQSAKAKLDYTINLLDFHIHTQGGFNHSSSIRVLGCRRTACAAARSPWLDGVVLAFCVKFYSTIQHYERSRQDCMLLHGRGARVDYQPCLGSVDGGPGSPRVFSPSVACVVTLPLLHMERPPRGWVMPIRMRQRLKQAMDAWT